MSSSSTLCVPNGTSSLTLSGARHGGVSLNADYLRTSPRGERRRPLPRLDHRVAQAVVDGLRSGQDLVALDVLADLLDRTGAVGGDHLLQQLAHPQDLVGLDLD